MAYLKRLKTNCKGDADIGLAPCTVIVGANASGKSCIVSAIELLLTGKLEGLGDRPRELGNDGQLFVHGELDNGTVVKYELGQTKKRTGRTGIVASKIVNELVAFGPKKAKERLLGLLGVSEDLLDTPIRLRSKKAALSRVLGSIEKLKDDSGRRDKLELDINKAKAGNRTEALRNDLIGLAGKIVHETRFYDVYDSLFKVRQENKLTSHCLACGAPKGHGNADKVHEVAAGELQAARQAKAIKNEIDSIESRFSGSILMPISQDVLRRLEDELKSTASRPYVSAGRNEVESIKCEIREISAEEKAVEARISDVLYGQVDEIRETVSALTGEAFYIALDQGDFSFGYTRRDANVPFLTLSGAERAICASALACALAGLARKGDELTAVIVDDVWLDEASSEKLLSLLSCAVEDGLIDQAVVTMVNGSSVGDGWKTVRL